MARARTPGPTYDGKPCIRCDSTLRYTHTRRCADCQRARNRANVDYFREYRRAEREDHVTYYSALLANRRRAALKRKEARHGALQS